ncbi:MAG TPA: AAA family ATPase [Candidatus Limnocylindrales bacterium]|nr:AAA family ATPase [Candidatus Limnocylindrales bacterium]
MARRLSSPVFVGRRDELQTLVEAADVAASGGAALVLVGGEAGVGKTRLVAEAAAGLRDRDWLVLEGGTVALGDDGLPFGPIVQALRALVRDVDPDRIALAAGPTLPELARLVPELSMVVGDGARPGDQVEWLQTRIFEGILRLLGRLGEGSPVLLIIEDLHWADRSTRDLLAFLARNARDERLLIVGTFRTDELHRRHPLTSWLAEAERHPRVERVDLERFERDELVELLEAITGGTPPQTLVDSVARRSDGNAFFAEELVAAVDETGQRRERLPETLRGVLLVHLSAAPERARRLVEIAAVAGRVVDHEILAEVCGLTEPEMGLALHEAVDAQLLVIGPDDEVAQYGFRHALVQEAAYDELLPSERRALHGAYARAIEARPAGGGAAAASRLVELAHHWTAAHEPARALAAAIEAGEASRAAYAYADAVRQYERAIELWDIVPVVDRPTDRDLADLYDAASSAATLVGDAGRAVTFARRAVDLVDDVDGTGGDRERRARAREQCGRAAWLAGDTATSIKLLEEAVDLLDGTPPSTRLARVLAGLAQNLMLAGRSGESVAFAERAIETARAIGDAGIESRAMNVLGVDRATLGDIAGGIDLLRRALAIALPADDPTEVPRAYANLGSVLEMGGFVEEALEVTLSGAASARRYSTELSFRTFLEVNAAGMLIELSRYPEAADLLDRNADRVLPGVTTIHLNVTLAHLHLLTGDLPAARRELEIARSEAVGLADAQFVIDIHAFGTEIEAWSGDFAAALAIARDGFDRLVDMDDAIILGQLAIPGVRAAADLAVRARAGRDAAAAGAAVDAASDVIARYRAAADRLAQPDELAEKELGWRMALCAAELARAAGQDDAANWDAVRPALTGRPAPFLEAYVLWRTAEAVAGAGGSAGAAVAAEPLRRAHAIATRIGAGVLVAQIEGLARRMRLDLARAEPVSGGGPADTETAAAAPDGPADPFGLTTREREVLALVAEGYTNRRIADTLFISESTAGVHVSHILGKLGVETRTEAAAVAVRLGLDRDAAG